MGRSRKTVISSVSQSRKDLVEKKQHFYFRIVLDFDVYDEDYDKFAFDPMIVKYVKLLGNALSSSTIRNGRFSILSSYLPFGDPND